MNKADQVAAIEKILGKSKKKNHTSGQEIKKKVDRHVWSIQDELMVIDLYKNSATKEEIKEAAEKAELKLLHLLLSVFAGRFQCPKLEIPILFDPDGRFHIPDLIFGSQALCF